ncbi:hypothetical protein IJI72_01325 [Candidatus Saccharibacteria bacterium]|nr:hypothetical protein [Candidatus Saccharibacteria bacterium]
MKEIGLGFKKIFREEKGLLLLMGLLFVLGVALAIHTLIKFKVGTTMFYVGYADIGGFSGGDFLSLWNSGGYRTGDYWAVLVFPIMGLILAVLHNMLAIQIFNRRGKGFAQLFLLMSLLVGGVAFGVLLRLAGVVK